MSDIPSNDLAPRLRRVIKDTKKVYIGAGRWLVDHHPSLLGDRASGFVELMDDLHRGLLVKIYATVIRADGQWTRTEKIVGAILIEHLWGTRLTGGDLRDAAQQVLSQADSLSWRVLVRPFVDYEPLRDRHSQIETCVSRLANLVAKCDGLISPDETDVLHRLQKEIIEALLLKPTGTNDSAVQVGTPVVRGAHQRDVTNREDDSDNIGSSSSEEKLAASMAELDELIGLANVKERVRSLANYLRLQRQRAAAGLPTMPITLHMSFVGNPGTGKTTVARIVAQVLGAMGVLKKGHVVETDRSGLVAEFAGQTAPKTNAIVDSALDGVLFIDEAYSLIDESGDDAFGREAIQTLLKRMEDDRERLVVILAGYSEEMDQMIRSNPGLSSRVGTRLEFEDYDPQDLGRIFELMCDANHYQLPSGTRYRILVGLTQLYQQRDRHFGNGRLARNCFEESVRQLANRVADIMPLTEELLTTLEPQDVVILNLESDAIDQAISAPHTLRVACPECDKRLRIKPSLLGRKVQCRKCSKIFEACWAQIEREV